MRSTVWNDEVGDRVAHQLFETGSYLLDMSLPREDWYRWKSGIRAPCYCNCRYLNRSYQAYEEITAFFETVARIKFPKEIDLIVGLASAGVSWAARIADRFRLPLSFVRTTEKAHGVGKLVEGMPDQKCRAVIIDDLCGSGGTIEAAIQALQDEYQIETLGCITITNWGFDHMWKRFEPYSVEILSLTSYPNILRVGHELGHVTEAQVKVLSEFYRNPLTFEWPDLNP